jgi:pimeloyl-ACP methyl ester carboxylesterase
MAPIFMLPGLSGSVLVNVKAPRKVVFGKKIVDNRWLNIHPYSMNYMKRWKNDMKCDFRMLEGKISGYKNINHDIQPYDLYGVEGIQDVVGDFELLSKPYQDALHNIFNYRYFYDVNQVLLEKGYVAGDDLIGFPWDFRLILDPVIRGHVFSLLYHKIEGVVAEKGEKVVLMGHSLGGVLIKWFLDGYATREWYEEHVERLVLINVPFGGTPSAVKALFIGDYFVPYFNQFFVEELRHNSGIVMGLPNRLGYNVNDVFWYSDDTKKSVTMKDYLSLSSGEENVGFKLWHDLYQRELGYLEKVNYLPVTIVNSIGIETPGCYWSKSVKDTPYKVVSEDGDGIIPTRSLNVGLELFPNYKLMLLPKTNHTQAISHPKFLEYIRRVT